MCVYVYIYIYICVCVCVPDPAQMHAREHEHVDLGHDSSGGVEDPDLATPTPDLDSDLHLDPGSTHVHMNVDSGHDRSG